MQKKIDIARIGGHLKEVRKYIGGLFVTVQAQIINNKAICPVCHEKYRCYGEDECLCTKCRISFFVYY